jgi:hypothetical protein
MSDYNFIKEMAGTELESRASITKRLVEKWGKTNLLKKLSKGKGQIMANLLEQEARGLKQLNEGSTVSDIAGFNKIAFPLVRRVFAQLIANEIVSVQPMSLPAGLLFYLDFYFDRNKSGFASGGSVYGNKSPIVNTTLDGVGAMTAGGAFYELNSGYSTRSYLLSANGITGTGGLLSEAVTSALIGQVTPVRFTIGSLSAKADLAQLFNMRLALSSELNLATNSFNGATPIENLTADTLWGTYDPSLTRYTANTLTFYVNATGVTSITAAAGSGTSKVLVYGPMKTDLQDNPKSTVLGDFEAVTGIPQLNISISSVPVMAQTRKLKTQWTPELAQDLNAYHALDAEVELTTILSEAIALEIDREILGELIKGASVKAAWSRKIGKYVSLSADGVIVSNQSFADASNATYQAFFGTQQDWYQTLGETVTTVSNEIHKRSLRHGANFIVTSPEISSIIESINGFKPTILSDASEVEYSFGTEKTGTLSSRYTLYKDPYFPADLMLLGYKGGSFLETGFVYAPYVPLLVTPTIFAPEDFTPRRMVMTRYAKQMVRPEMYGVIRVIDINFIGSPASA